MKPHYIEAKERRMLLRMEEKKNSVFMKRWT